MDQLKSSCFCLTIALSAFGTVVPNLVPGGKGHQLSSTDVQISISAPVLGQSKHAFNGFCTQTNYS